MWCFQCYPYLHGIPFPLHLSDLVLYQRDDAVDNGIEYLLHVFPIDIELNVRGLLCKR